LLEVFDATGVLSGEAYSNGCFPFHKSVFEAEDLLLSLSLSFSLPSPDSPNFRLGQVIPSPPRSSSLASGWSKSSITSPRCQPFIKKDEERTPSSTKVDFGPSQDYHGSLEAYRFPDRSSSAVSTPAVSRSPSTISMNTLQSESEISPPTLIPKVHSPLGSATASRRGSLVSSPPLTLRSRAGSVVAGGAGYINRNAIYEYI